MLKINEPNLWDITINDVLKITAEDGDILLVALPPQSLELPNAELDSMYRRVAEAFEQVFSDKDVKVLIVPHGMEVQLIKSSDLQDK